MTFLWQPAWLPHAWSSCASGCFARADYFRCGLGGGGFQLASEPDVRFGSISFHYRVELPMPSRTCGGAPAVGFPLLVVRAGCGSWLPPKRRHPEHCCNVSPSEYLKVGVEEIPSFSCFVLSWIQLGVAGCRAKVPAETHEKEKDRVAVCFAPLLC